MADLPPRLPSRTVMRARVLALKILLASMRPFVRIEVEGLEHVPAEGPAILVFNHVNPLESPLPWALFGRPDIWIIASPNLKANRKYRWLIRPLFNVAYFERGGGVDALVASAEPLLASGAIVALSPEGRYSRTGRLGAGKPGPAAVACHTGVAMLPFVTAGFDRLTDDLRRLRRGRVKVRIGPLFRFTDNEANGVSFERQTAEIMVTLARLLPTEYRGDWAGHCGET